METHMAYRDIQTASLYAENDTITEAWREWAIQRKCVHCGTYYTLLDSFGARQCRQHSQPKTVKPQNDGRDGEFFPCCKKWMPRPNYFGAGSIIAPAQLMNQFMATTCYQALPVPSPPPGCVLADHSDGTEIWPIGLVNMEAVKDKIRPVGGWKVNSTVVIDDQRYTVRSPPDPFGMVRVEADPSSEGSKTMAHVKDMQAPSGYNMPNTVELMDETGKTTDKITRMDGKWRKWSAGVSISDIAGLLPFMVNHEKDPFASRLGVSDEVPVVWRINVPTKIDE